MKMPKLKTKSAAKKRFIVTGTGRVKFKQAFSRHMMMNKPQSMKRKARGMDILCESNEYVILDNYLPYEKSKKRIRLRKSRNPKTAEGKPADAKSAPAAKAKSKTSPKAKA
jgi:large subunit ribosomal protein L35